MSDPCRYCGSTDDLRVVSDAAEISAVWDAVADDFSPPNLMVCADEACPDCGFRAIDYVSDDPADPERLPFCGLCERGVMSESDASLLSPRMFSEEA